MSLLGRIACKLNGHFKSVGGHFYQLLEESYILSEDLSLRYCTRCHKVTLYARDHAGSRWNPSLGTLVYNPLAYDDECWVHLGE